MGQTLSEPETSKHTTKGKDNNCIYGASCMQGWRITMEDAHVTLLNLSDTIPLAYFAVFDGHGGDKAAKYCGKNVHLKIQQEPTFSEGNYPEAIRKGFLDTDDDMRKLPEFMASSPGCTAVAALLTLPPNRKVFVGNAGDSRAIMSRKGVAVELSHDHKPSNEGERERIYNAGGFVEFNRVNGNLALSRAIGDFDFKRNPNMSPENQIVTANPDVLTMDITEDDEFIVIACDGIWDCMTNDKVVSFVRSHIAKGESLDRICELLMDRCLSAEPGVGQFGCDNMTVIIVGLLNDGDEAEFVARCSRKSDSNEPEEEEPAPETATAVVAAANGVQVDGSA